MAHESGSFDYKVIRKEIRQILEARSELNNTVQVAMPFVKATTTIGGPQVSRELNGGIGFTLGLHAIDQDVKYEDIFSSQDGQMPLLGYTYVDGKTQRVYARDPETDVAGQIFAGKIFDKRAGLFTNTNVIRMPPPGITNVTVGRSKNGLLASAQLTISIPSLIQLENLHRLFLVPGVGMVLEWGQQFAQESGARTDIGELPDISQYMFPWHNQNETLKLIRRLAENNIGIQEILEDYVYPSQGQYMWMFGRVANFNVTSLSDGSFQASVKIVGPSEDSWAYSTKNTVVPVKDASSKFFCESDTNSVYSYFGSTAHGGINLKTLLDRTIGGDSGIFSLWKGHVHKFTPDKKKEEPKPDETKPNINEVPFLETDDAYFMTWRFFVNVVLNDPNVGVKKIFASVLDQQTLNKIGMLRPYFDGPQRQSANVSAMSRIDDPLESFVGYNKFLRSVDPSVMIIVNEEAAKAAAANPQYNISDESKEFLKVVKKVSEFSGAADGIGNFRFDTSAQAYNTDKADRGFLSTGVWINHKAVVECMLGGDTIVKGITNLLERMNQATLNYWQLTLDAAEPVKGKPQSYNYMVVDANFRDNSQNAVNKFMDEVHVFNKYVRVDKETGKLVGSELIESSIDLSLPKRLFSQIATLGLVQRDDLEKAGITRQTDFSDPKTPKVGDPNDTLRSLYATLVIDPSSDTEQGPDLTILPRNQRAGGSGICGKQNVQTTAQVAGNSGKTGNIPINYQDKSVKELESLTAAAEATLAKSDCKLCEQCLPTSTAQPAQPTNVSDIPQEVTYLTQNNTVQRVAVSLNDEGDSASSRMLFAAGHRNGRLDPSVLKSVSGGGQMYKEAADSFNRMAVAASAANISLRGSGTYRDILRQISLVQEKGLYSGPPANGYKARNGTNGYAATPGTSNHGWGLAIDIDVKDSKNSAEFKWLENNAGNYGFTFPDLPGEPWHWEYTRQLEEPIPPPAQQSVSASSTTASASTIPSTGVIGGVNCAEQLKKPAMTIVPGIDPLATGGVVDIAPQMTACEECNRAKAVVNQSSKILEEKKEAENLVQAAIRQFNAYRSIFRYVEIFPEYMVAEITYSADGNFANAFGAAPGSLSISGDLTMPGINGLRVGELFWIDRIPAFYRVFGAFQIMSIEDRIEVSGWKTQINARFNFLGRKWREAMETKFKNEMASQSQTPSQPR